MRKSKSRSLKSAAGKLAALCGLLFVSNAYAGDLTVNATSSTGGALTGAKYQVFKGPNYVGEYAVGTTISLTTGSTYTMFAHYSGTSTARQTFVSSASGDVYNFKTTNVTLHFSGGYLDFKTSGSWSSFGQTSGVWNSRELFPRDYYGNIMEIQTGYVWNDVRGYTFTLNYEGLTSVEKTISILRVQDHNGNPISGVTFRGGAGSSYSTYFVSGSTNSNGLLADIQNGNNTHSYEAKVNNTTAVVGPQNSNSNAYFLFKTIEVTLKLETCGGSPLSGGTARYGIGASYGTWFFPSPNSTNSSGETKAEFFPGTYSIEMNYQSSAEVKSSVTIPNANTTLTWKTTNLSLSWPYDIAYGGSGDNRYFSKPSMELLPGTLNFNFRGVGNNYVAITVSGCSMSYKPVVVKLISSSNAPLSGGYAKYHTGAWTNIGSTNSNGTVLALLPNGTTNAYFEMAYNNGKQQIYQNIASNPVVTFQTKNVVVELRDHNNNLLSEATDLQYHQGAWNTFASGTTSGGKASMELLGGNYYFRLKYNNGAQEKYQNVGTTPTVTFTTNLVTVELRDHDNNLLSEATNLQYHQGAWNTFATGTTSSGQATMELLPGNYYFRLKYNNGAQEKYQNVGTNPTVTFTTKEVIVELRDHNGDLLSDATGVEYHQGAWNTFASGVTSNGQASMELLPGNYYFRLKFNNGAQEKYQNIGTTPTVTFTTKLVTMELRDHNGDLLGEGNNLKYHQGAWNTFGSGATTGGTETMELLPGNYYFRMGYSNGTQEKYQNIGTTPTVTFTTTYVTLNLSNTTPAGISGGSASYHQGAWNTFGTTDANGNTSLELLPGNYYFRMAYNSYTKDKYTSVSGVSQTVNFTYTGTGINRVANKNGKNPLVNLGNQNANTNETVANAEKANAVSTLSCYPNPTTATTTVNYTLASEQNVQVAVYNSNGTQVTLVVNEMQNAGAHSAIVNAAELAGGIYYVRIVTPAGVQQVPVVVNK